MRDGVQDKALAYIGDHHVMTLATVGAGPVWAAAVFYVNVDFDLFFLSAGHTRHGRDLAERAYAAATIHENYVNWSDIKGIQLEGAVELLEGAARNAAMERYRARFTFLDAAPAALTAALERVNWYCLRPERLYYIDNSQGFGHREELILRR